MGETLFEERQKPPKDGIFEKISVKTLAKNGFSGYSLTA